ncbi:SMI1 / KNR4 family protein [Gemmata sp. SH-PL17]|uniref:SMI1/KNR4 family protein n=1 Tax=Gemmata sp. SH-PL17 TaxID=1630693 RepID=UPI00078B8146|nr:SMI1/KNR4 family protein [Gemmata sp. SH-PL17]AMV27517.1 SMI1 / KNR4 family protein [Gemmata sp. SH-PL17]
MTIDDLIAALEATADRARSPLALRVFGPDRTPPPSPAQVEAFEAEIGAPLPDEYRAFLLRCNGGNLDGYQFDGPTPEGEWTAVVSRVGGLRDEPHLSLRSARASYQGYEVQIPRALVWIMGDPGGNAICLGLTGEHRGRVYFWVHDEGPDPDSWDGAVETAGNVVLLANSFTDFVAGLRAREE